MSVLLFSTIIVFSSAIAKFVVVSFWRLFSRRSELLPGVLSAFAAPVLDLTGWGVCAFLRRREVGEG